MGRTSVTVAIDTEEDNWGAWVEEGATTRNIEHLLELQDLFGKWGARPTYLVNRPPLMWRPSVEILGRLARDPSVEIGAHCHPWNTPPSTGSGEENSMMCDLPLDANTGKIGEVTTRLEAELGVRPVSFRTGRWGFGPSVSKALAIHGYLIDASVSPFVDWSPDGGPDYTHAMHRPYRFDPARPFESDADGAMVEIPTTIGFMSGAHRMRSAIRQKLVRSPLRRLHVLGALDRLGMLTRRWLSPEVSSADDMIRLAETNLRTGEPVLGVTFHSCTLLPGATPFVTDGNDRSRFLEAIDRILRFCAEARLEFKTLSEVGRPLLGGTLASSSSPRKP